MLLGSHDDAVQMMREAVDGRERQLGADHPLAVKARVFLAERLAAAGQHEEARQLLDENLANAERIYGPDDPDLQRARLIRPQWPPHAVSRMSGRRGDSVWLRVHVRDIRVG